MNCSQLGLPTSYSRRIISGELTGGLLISVGPNRSIRLLRPRPLSRFVDTVIGRAGEKNLSLKKGFRFVF